VAPGSAAWAAPDAVVAAVLAAGLGTAAAIDVRSRRVPNGVSLATAAAGVGLAATGASGITVWASLLGFVVGLVLMLPGHVLGATGAGDAKLFAAAGAVMGVGRVFEAFLLVAIAGGVLAFGIALQRGRLRRTLGHLGRLVGRPGETRKTIESAAEHNRFPYAPAVAAGCLLAALWW
jgi:prepilin peptidase CpaA